MEIFEFTSNEVISYQNPPDDTNESIECTVMNVEESIAESVERHYRNIEDSLNTHKPVNTTDSNSLLVKLCNIKQSVEAIERAALQLYQQRQEKSNNVTDELVSAAIKKVSHATSNSLPIDYKVKYPMQLTASKDIKTKVNELRRTISSVQSMLTILEEQCDKNSLSSLLAYIEQVISMLNPGFLRRMETDYASAFRQYIWSMDKKQADKPIILKRLETIYQIANALSQHVTEVDILLSRLHHEKRRIEQWDALVSNVGELEKKQELCIQTLREDQQILVQLQENLRQARAQLEKNKAVKK